MIMMLRQLMMNLSMVSNLAERIRPIVVIESMHTILFRFSTPVESWPTIIVELSFSWSVKRL